MKKILWLAIIFSFLFASHSFATNALSVASNGTTITATMTGATGSTSSYKLLLQTTPYATGAYTGTATSNKIEPIDSTISKVNSVGVVNWIIPNNKANTVYYVRALEIPAVISIKPKYATDSTTITTKEENIGLIPLKTSVTGNNILVVGKIDTTTTPNFIPSNYTAKLSYSSTPQKDGATTLTDAKGPLSSRAGADTEDDDVDTATIDPDGNYHWVINGTSPSTIYSLQQTVTDTLTDTVKVDTIDSVNSSQGNIILPGSAAQGADLNSRSYTLLSGGLPGLSIIPDPDLCAQQKAAAVAGGKTPPVCSVSDLINYAVTLMIGLSGAFLVLRLMFEGYQYMVSDVPRLKANAKSGFLTALGGLLLALTAYIILNTVNPKLVDETINVQQLSIGVAGDDGLGVPGTSSGGKGTNRVGGPVTLALSGGGTASVTACNPTQLATVPTLFGHKDVQVQKNLVPSLERIDAKWQQMTPRYPVNTVGGYNCRTIASIATISYHAYGLAVDVNEDTNGVGTAGNMPASFIKLWTDEGWGWGGNWSSKKDPMHFSKGKNEQGNLVGQ